jgi:O-antigen ligase
MRLAWQQSAGWALTLAAVASLPLAVPAPLGLAPLLLAAAAIAAASALADRGAALASMRKLAPIAALMAMLALWGLVGSAWSIAPMRSVEMAVRLAITSLAGLLILAAACGLEQGGRQRLALWLSLGTGLGAVLLAGEVATGLGLLRLVRGTLGERPPIDVLLNRAATVLVLLEWPVAVALWRRFGTGAAASWLAAALAVLIYLSSASALLASLVGLAAATLGFYRPRLAGGGIAGLSALGTLFLPLFRLSVPAINALSPWVKASGVHRLVIWSFASVRIAERPFLGWGLDTARVIPGGGSTVEVMTRQGPMQAEQLPLHPHSAALQWWLELGLPGALIGAALFVMIMRSVLAAGWGRVETAAALGMIAGATVIAMLSYGIWQFWWLAALWLAAAFAAAIFPGLSPARTPS